LRFGLLVGIGGGVPVQTDNGMIRLGHVVVSKPAGGHSGALQYDHGKAKDGHFERTGALAPPPAVLLNAAQTLAVQRARLDVDPVQHDVCRIDITRRRLRRFQYPGERNDYLFPPHYEHQRQGACSTKCDLSKRIPRTSDVDDTFVIVHRGNIASGELVVKDALLRDTLAQQDGLLCFEMEAAGAIADFPCLVVRGISDYCDSHKNDMWHGYAAAVAAAYARQLFFHLPVDEVQRCSGNATQTASSFILPFKLPKEVNSVSHFVARQEELGRLHKELKWTGDRRTVILHGLGGMGKTQTTIAFAKKHRDDYSAVVWLDARDTITLKQSYRRLAQRIMKETTSVTYINNAFSNPDLDETVSAVKRWLDEPKNNRWLMIYDNYDDVKLHNRGNPSENEAGSQVGIENDAGETGSKAYDIRPYFPETDHGAILVTTRSSTVELGQLIQLSKLGDVNDSLEILKSTSNRANLAQGNLYSDQGRLKEAEAMYDRALQGYEKALGPDHTSTLNSVHSLGILYSDQGRLKEAEAMYDRALQGYEKALGPDHKSTLNTVNNLGLLYYNQGRLKEAEAMYDRALQGYEKALGPEHTSTLDTVNNLGILYKDQGRLKEAEAMYDRALQGYEKARGPDHTSTLDTVHNLGSLYKDQGRLDEAEAMYERALQGCEKALGPDHTSTLNTVN
ncbi:Kinesin light chain, partial [Colletotrichum fructicola]